MFKLFRPDSSVVWNNPIIIKRFSHYHGVQRGLKTAKYLIVKKTPVSESNIQDHPLSVLWQIHKNARNKFNELNIKIEKKELAFEDIETPSFSFMDLKVLIAKKMLQECHFCERRCGVNRTKRELGFCRLWEKNSMELSILRMLLTKFGQYKVFSISFLSLLQHRQILLRCARLFVR